MSRRKRRQIFWQVLWNMSWAILNNTSKIINKRCQSLFILKEFLKEQNSPCTGQVVFEVLQYLLEQTFLSLRSLSHHPSTSEQLLNQPKSNTVMKSWYNVVMKNVWLLHFNSQQHQKNILQAASIALVLNQTTFGLIFGFCCFGFFPLHFSNLYKN